MQGPVRLGHCIFHSEQPCLCELSREKAIGVFVGERLEAPVCPPFVTMSIVRRGSSRMSTGLSIVGRAGERYRNVPRGPWPRSKTVDERQKVRASGKFDYG